jgi:hypothetical protein
MLPIQTAVPSTTALTRPLLKKAETCQVCPAVDHRGDTYQGSATSTELRRVRDQCLPHGGRAAWAVFGCRWYP